jgi:hypothetical protein
MEQLLNIAWLGAGFDFPRGSCPRGLVDLLIARASRPVALTRGVHHCEFCTTRSPITVKSDVYRVTATLGNGEIAVQSLEAATYRAPTLIVHYITAHQYLPPAGFIEAVMREENPPTG